jgi:hypothetical protein
MKGRAPIEDRHATLVAEMRGDGITPDGHDPEMTPVPLMVGFRRRCLSPIDFQLNIFTVMG